MKSATVWLLVLADSLYSVAYQCSGCFDCCGQYLNHQEDLGGNEEPQQ